MSSSQPSGPMGGLGLSGRFTRLGKTLAIYYTISYVLGGLITLWWQKDYILQLLLNPLSAGRFAPWQLLTHLLVLTPSPDSVLGFLLDMLMLWLFAWQLEYSLGSRRFLALIFGIPVAAGLLGLPLTLLQPFAYPLAGFSLVMDILVVAYCMQNRASYISFMLIAPMRADKLILALVAVHVLGFIFRANPLLGYQLAAIGLTWLVFRFDLLRLNGGERRFREKRGELRRRNQRFTVVPGGRDDDEDPPVYH